MFGKLKTVFTTEPILAIPDIDSEMRVKANISNCQCLKSDDWN